MTSYPTPKYLHLSEKDFEKIYEPAEDSFLMIDTLEKDAELIKKMEPLICLEIGPGSGIVVTFLASIIGPKAFYLASDINERASLATIRCGQENKVDINTTTDNLITSLKDRLESKVDLLIFNPPYVVTPSEEVGGTSLSASWAGGINGREVIDRLLPLAVSILSQNGTFYLLLIKENQPDDIVKIMLTYGFRGLPVMKRRAGREHLSVYRFSRF